MNVDGSEARSGAAPEVGTGNVRSGVPDRIRTDDIQLGKLTLYQLSYGHPLGGRR